MPNDVQQAVDEALKQTNDSDKQEFIRGYLRYDPKTQSVQDFQKYLAGYEDPNEEAAQRELVASPAVGPNPKPTTTIQVLISAQVEVEVECDEGWNPETDSPTLAMYNRAEQKARDIVDATSITNYDVNAM